MDILFTILAFAVCVFIARCLDALTRHLIPNDVISFLVLHATCLPWIQTTEQWIWLVLTVLHGLAHLAHPAYKWADDLYVYNRDYTPFYDYVVHAAQCLTAAYYGYTFMGILFAIDMLAAGSYAHINRKFLETVRWILMSFGGVFGTVFHMMLLSYPSGHDMIVPNVVIWTLPYIGYLSDNLVGWDLTVNKYGLFRTWYYAYFVAHLLILG